MKILITGSTGYIAKNLIPLLLKQKHHLVLLTRDPFRVCFPQEYQNLVTVLTGDLLDSSSLKMIPKDIDAAYYLVHSMHQSRSDFTHLEEICALNFVQAIKETNCHQVIYLSGLSSGKNLSPHFTSRRKVEDILKLSEKNLTVLRSSIIIGAGSASFEIIRDLVEKLPIMVAPKWVQSRTQPIALVDALDYLVKVLNNPKCYNEIFDIGGPEVFTYKELLLKFAALRGLTRYIITVPVLTPQLSSYWLILVTSTSYNLARSLIDSLKNDSVCQDLRIQLIIPKQCLDFASAVERSFQKLEDFPTFSWKDSLVQSELNPDLSSYMQVPSFGCLSNIQKVVVPTNKLSDVLLNIWSIGGERGWYYWNWAWYIRGLIDKFIGGSGLRRGRTHPFEIRNGDALDFWRVLLADKKQKRLLLYAEMKVPGEAWLEFKLEQSKENYLFIQTATFRPRGILGRLYWWVLYPFHWFIFRGMAQSIVHTPAPPSK